MSKHLAEVLRKHATELHERARGLRQEATILRRQSDLLDSTAWELEALLDQHAETSE